MLRPNLRHGERGAQTVRLNRRRLVRQAMARILRTWIPGIGRPEAPQLLP